MTPLYKRIKTLRRTLSLSQEAFGAKLGISRSVVNNLERNITKLKQPLFSLICTTYNVNPDWLINGDGEMFVAHQTITTNSLKKEYELSDIEYQILNKYLSLPSESRKVFLNTLVHLISNNEQ